MDKKLLKTEFIKDRASMQINVEGEVIISDAQPDIKEIIYESAKPAITFFNVSDGRINFKGVLMASAVYISKDENEPVSSVSSTINFEDIMNIDGLLKDDCVRTYICVDHYEFRKINERKISLKAVITLVVYKFNLSECTSLLPESVDEGMELLTKSDVVRNHVIQTKNDFDIHETFSIPASKPEAVEILTEFYNISDLDTKALRGGYRISGVLNVDIVYLTEESGRADLVRFEVPFEQTIDNDDVMEDMYANSLVDVISFKTGVFQDSSNENRIIDIDAVFSEITDMFEDEKITFVKDAYSIKYPCSIDMNKITMPIAIGKNKARFNLKGVASQNNGTNILQVIGSDGNVTLDSVYAQNGYVAAEGVAEVTVLYIAEDDSKPIYSVKAYLPFHHEIEINNVAEDDVVLADVYIDGISFNIMNSSEIEVNMGIVIDVNVTRLVEQEVVSSAEKDESAESGDIPAAVIYTVQSNDTLWDIAKNYNAVKEDIMSLNGIENEEELFDRKRILIMRKV